MEELEKAYQIDHTKLINEENSNKEYQNGIYIILK